MKDASAAPPSTDVLVLLPPGPALVGPAGGDASVEIAPTLPRDHPAWQRDVLAISARVRAILAGLQPVVVRVLTFWDHAVRSIPLGGRRVEIDPSGCYRLR